MFSIGKVINMNPSGNIKWHFACKVTDVSEGEIFGVCIKKTNVLISLFKGNYGCISDVCSHMGAALSGGHMDDGYVVCPFHGWQFCHVSGKMGERCEDTPYYPVDIRDDDIYIGFAS